MIIDPLQVWKSVKNTLPPIVTGAYEGSIGDAAPAEALYNLVFVRLPTVATGALYFARLSSGEPEIVMDLGLGQFEMSPILVVFIMWLILRPA